MIPTRPAALCAAAIALALPAQVVAGDWEISLYTGPQEAAHSGVRGSDPGGIGDFDFLAAWQGRSFAMPPHWGLRAMWWRTERVGYGVEVNHAKVYASDDTLATSGFTVLEFSDGLNILTANASYRWPVAGRRWTPYVGAGLGISVPHVEVTSAGGRVFEYQFAGPAATAYAGLSWKINGRWSAFGEYKATYSVNEVTLGSGGTLSTNIVTNAITFGATLKF